MAEVALEKVCECDGASASGPRIVQTAQFVPERASRWDRGLRARFAFVRLACDKCDTPWVATKGPGE